jgi:hypothetical protein
MSCISFTRRGGDHLQAALSAATLPTLSPTALRGRSSTTLRNMTIPTRTTPATKETRRRSIASGTRRKRSSRRSCPEHVLPSATSTSPATTPLAQRRMRRLSASQATSPAFAS